MRHGNQLIIALFLLGGCQQSSLPLPTLTPYKIDIQQGNVVTQEMVEKLKPGMTAAQVRFILGTPLVVDAFHKDRWDYVYRLRKGGTVVEHRRIVIVFQDDKLARVEGDVVVGSNTGAKDGGVKIDRPAPARGSTAPAAPAPKPEAAAPPVPQGSVLTTTSGEPVTSGAPIPDAASGAPKPKEEKPKEEKPAEAKPAEEKPKERGFFGRLLDGMGF